MLDQIRRVRCCAPSLTHERQKPQQAGRHKFTANAFVAAGYEDEFGSCHGEIYGCAYAKRGSTG
jgi:hypothetical protein